LNEQKDNLMRAYIAFLAGGLWAAMAVSTAWAADDEKTKQAAMTPQEADADFAVQGEYAGEVEGDEGKIKFGVQVIALGDGKFRAVGYPGGLPGAGWIGEGKVEVSGERDDGVPTFETDDHVSTVKDDRLEVRTQDGDLVATFDKVKRKSKTLGEKPPEGAVVLFDGSTAEAFEKGRLTKDGLLMQGMTSRAKFGDCKIHLEFMLSYMPHAREQGRSNSGCYLQGRYEVQILDSFGLSGENNECGGIYGVRKPNVNMCLPPLTWQTYDIELAAARFNEQGDKTADAVMSVYHNGVLVHKDVKVPEATRAAPLKVSPKPGPIYVQDHGNPLRFRNIWVLPQ
jgi:hypothetical protein